MRILPLLVVISTTIFHLVCPAGNLVITGTNIVLGEGSSIVNDDGNINDVGVFGSTCNADKIQVTNAEGDFIYVYPGRITRTMNLTYEQLEKKGLDFRRCGGVEGRRTIVFGLDCRDEPLAVDGFVKIDFPKGIITARGTRLTAKAVCKGLPSALICRDGTCTTFGTNSKVHEENESGSENKYPIATGETVIDWVGKPFSGGVFGSTCDADEIEVTGGRGSVRIDRKNHLVHLGGMYWTCNYPAARETVVFGSEALLDPLTRRCPSPEVFRTESNFVKIEHPNGIITTRGMGWIAKAVCRGRTSMVECRDGNCTIFGSGSEAPEESGGGSPTETDEEASGGGSNDGSTVEPVETASGDVDGLYSGGVFGSPCNASQIEVTGDRGSIWIDRLKYDQSTIFFIGNKYGTSDWDIPSIACDYSAGDTRVFGSNCVNKPIEFDGERGSFKIEFPEGIITTSGTEFTVKAVCRGKKSLVECRDGKCTIFDISIEAPEESGGGSTAKTDEEGSDSVTEGDRDDSDDVIGTTARSPINDNDDRSEPTSNPTTDKDSANGNSKLTTPAEKNDSGVWGILAIVGGILALVAIVALLVWCLKKKCSSNADEADLEEGNAETTNKSAADASEQ